jgi:pyrimidine operon attenuation protein / uracil phosphoribosyltransferase
VNAVPARALIPAAAETKSGVLLIDRVTRDVCQAGTEVYLVTRVFVTLCRIEVVGSYPVIRSFIKEPLVPLIAEPLLDLASKLVTRQRFLLVSVAVEFTEKARIMDEARINRALARLASEIVEENHGLTDLVLVGIRRRGVPLANRIADKIEDLEGNRPPVGILDITLYRDDLSTVGAKPIVSGTELPGDVEGRCIVLIDDVLYTGRTVRAALDQLIDFGRPRRVQLAVLIDRGNEHRELPIQADYIGKLVPTKKSEIIKVMLNDFDEDEGVVIVERPAAEAAA